MLVYKNINVQARMIVSPNIQYWLELDYNTTIQYYHLLLCPLVCRTQKSTYRIVTHIKIQCAKLYICMEIRAYGCRPYPGKQNHESFAHGSYFFKKCAPQRHTSAGFPRLLPPQGSPCSIYSYLHYLLH